MYYLMSLKFFLLSFFTFFMSMSFIFKKMIILINFNIMKLNFMNIEMLIFIDWMSLMFMSVVLLITSMVIIYSYEYMINDLNKPRFLMLIFMFILSMMFMIISPNMISILLGWDGLGLTSYCLVIYYQNTNSFNSGMITILMNRIGDICLIISISFMLMYKSWNLMMNFKIMKPLMILILILTFTKSAQVPFSSWLTKAMAAPTPISSLVHSSTLVTAGVYLQIRFFNLFPQNMLKIIFLLSLFTLLYSGISANFEYDLKKIIALSTLSQLSIMFISISFNQPMISFFHLISHAMFKSLLFLCSGILIHNNNNNQDIRLISLTSMINPFISMTLITASLSLCGLPFLSGFFSKDLIIEIFNMNLNNPLTFLFLYLSMMMTVSYTIRLIYFLMFKQLKISTFNYSNMFMNMNLATFPLIMMTLLLGTLFNWLIFNNLNMIILTKKIKILIFQLSLFSMMIPLILNKLYLKFMKNYTFYFLNKLFNLIIFLPIIFKKNKINFLKSSPLIMKLNDHGWMELIYTKLILTMKLNFNKKINNLNLNFYTIIYLIFMMYMLMTFL